MNAMGSFLKLVCHKNYENEHNFCQQVGIVGLEFIGQYTGKDRVMGRDEGVADVLDLISPRVPPVPPPVGGGLTSDFERHVAFGRGGADNVMWRSARAVSEAKEGED